jgi:transposase
MSKHTEQFKLAVIDRYLAGLEGYRLVGRHFGIAPAMVRRWVSWFRQFGAAGLTSNTRSFTPEFKLSVLEHMWDNSLSQTRVALIFNVRNTASIGIWERRYLSGGLEALASSSKRKSAPVNAPNSKPPPPLPSGDRPSSQEELLGELEHLRMENAVLKKFQALAQSKKKAAAQKKR